MSTGTGRTNVAPLIEFVNGKYVLNSRSKEWISSLTTSFGVMVCAGKFRTGKSFLLNQFQNSPPGFGFGVGDTVQACTRGIWCSTSLLKNDTGPDMLILDTEGIEAMDAENDHDVRIFALAVMMSSVFVYNSMSHLDEAAIQTLALMANVTSNIANQGHEPTMYWVLRDFSLQLTNSAGEQISHKEYLESALQSPLASKCKTREAIKTVFKKRHLVTLPRASQAETTQRLETTANSVQEKFKRFLATFRSHMLNNASPFTVNSTPLSGKLYVEHLQNLLDKLNEEGTIPKLQDTWGLLASAQRKEVEHKFRLRMLEAVDAAPNGTKEDIVAFFKTNVRVPEKHMFLSPIPSDEELTQLQDVEIERALLKAEERGKVQSWIDQVIHGVWRSCEQSLLDGTPFLPLPHNATFSSAQHQTQELLCDKFRQCKSMSEATYAAQTAKQLESEKELLQLQLDEANARNAVVMEEMVKLQNIHASKQFEHVYTSTDDLFVESGHAPGTHDAATSCDGEELQSSQLLMQASIDELNASNASLKDQISAAEIRENEIRKTFFETTDVLKHEAETNMHTLRREITNLQASGVRDQHVIEGITQERERLRLENIDAQKRISDMHRISLEDAQARDRQTHAWHDKNRMEWGDMQTRIASAQSESRGMKRRLDELLSDVSTQQATTLKLQRTEIERVRQETLAVTLQKHLNTLREDFTTLQREHSELQKRAGTLEAAAKLEEVRRGFASGL